MEDLFIVDSRVLKSPTTTVLLSISYLKSYNIFFIYFSTLILGAYMLQGSYRLVDNSLKYYILTILVSYYGLCFKSILSDISIATSAFFHVHLHGIFFPNTSLSACVDLLFWGGSLVDNLYVGHVFFTIQLLCVFWLEHLIHLHLRLLLIGTYSLPLFPFVPVFLSLFLFLLLLKVIPLASLAILT